MADADDLYAPGPYAPMALSYDEDPKIAALARYGEDAGLCRDLHLAAIRYGSRARTDGLAVGAELRRLAYPLPPERADQIIAHLAEAELLTPADGTSLADAAAAPLGVLWRAANWEKWNRTRAWLERQSAAKSAAGRRGAEVTNRKRRARERPGRSSAPAGAAAGAAADARQVPQQVAGTSTGTNTGSSGSVREQQQDRSAHPREEDAAADLLDRIDNALVALALGGGHPVTREMAAAYRAAKLTGRTPNDPMAYVLGPVRKNPRLVAEHAAKADPHATESRQPAPVNQLCRRCSSTRHPTDQCPERLPARTDDRELVGEEGGGAAARKLMANRERPARTGPAPAPELHGEALARAQAAASRAERGSAPRPPEPEEPEPEQEDQQDPAEHEPEPEREEDAEEYEVPF